MQKPIHPLASVVFEPVNSTSVAREYLKFPEYAAFSDKMAKTRCNGIIRFLSF